MEELKREIKTKAAHTQVKTPSDAEERVYNKRITYTSISTKR